jgi:hypothetical protein
MRSQGGVLSPGELGGCGAGDTGITGVVGVVGAGVGGGLDGGIGFVGGAGVGGGCRITDISCDTVSLAASVAVIVIRFPPMLRGTAGMFQFTEPDAVPVNPVLVRHATRTGPVPPDAVPEMAMEVAVVVVVSAEFCIVRKRGKDGGAGVWAGAEPSRVPYIAWTTAMSPAPRCVCSR